MSEASPVPTPPKKVVVLVVDDERDHAEVMAEGLSRQGYTVDVAYDLGDARARLTKKTYDVVVTDLMMEGRRDGLEVLELSKKQEPPPPVILVTAVNDVPTSKEAMASGAYDYIVKPLDLDTFRAQVARAAEKNHLVRQTMALQAQLMEGSGFEGIIGRSAIMQKVINTARQVAASDIPVLITGESGTGKELISRAIHNSSRRRKQRLVALNCAGLSESILEDELFGHVKGAFTGAQAEREGRFEHADNGTLFMDEIGDMPSTMQAKLLRVLENGEVVRLGSNDPIRVNVRLISATNRNLEEMVAERKFREDLYFRIKGVTIHLPALRERRDDIPLLVHYFVQQFAQKYNKPIRGVDAEVQQALMAYGWPGNVRQLRNAIENMVVMAGDAPNLPADVLPSEIRPFSPRGAVPATSIGGTPSVLPQVADDVSGGLVGISLEQAERELIRNTLKMTNGNREQAAEMLGIGERTLYRKIKEYDL